MNYVSPSSGEAYRDRRLATNFELNFLVCRHVSMWGFQNRVCLSIRPPVRLSVCLCVPQKRKRNHHSVVNISPTLVIATPMEKSSRVLHHGNPKTWIFSKKFKNEFWIVFCLTCFFKFDIKFWLVFCLTCFFLSSIICFFTLLCFLVYL